MLCIEYSLSFFWGEAVEVEDAGVLSGVIFLEWQIYYWFFFAGKETGHQALRLVDVLYFLAIVVVGVDVFYFFTAFATYLDELLFPFNSKITTTNKIGGNASCGGACKGVEHPSILIGRSKDDACQQSQWFLCGMLAAGLFPWSNGRQSPNICHLLVIV